MLETTGEMAEWSIAAVLKTVELRGSGGSNPSLSAIKGVNQVVTRFTPFFTPKNIRLTVRKLRVMFYKTNFSKIKHISAFLNHCRNHLL